MFSAWPFGVAGSQKPCEVHKIMVIDAKKAHLNGEVLEDENVFVLLPSEAGGGGGGERGSFEAVAAWHASRGQGGEEALCGPAH